MKQKRAICGLELAIGERVRLLRERIGISQAELAGRVNRKRVAVWRWERGEGLSFGVVEELAVVFQVSADRLLSGATEAGRLVEIIEGMSEWERESLSDYVEWLGFRKMKMALRKK